MGECVDVYVKVIKPGEHLEVTYLQTYQRSRGSRSNDTKKLCDHKGASMKRGGTWALSDFESCPPLA
uniref:Uncharacterized protein n=1 Tax=Leersia perrieri TaxID=77586 RepID=A0A0D9VGN7_9ORYZ